MEPDQHLEDAEKGNNSNKPEITQQNEMKPDDCDKSSKKIISEKTKEEEEGEDEKEIDVKSSENVDKPVDKSETIVDEKNRTSSCSDSKKKDEEDTKEPTQPDVPLNATELAQTSANSHLTTIEKSETEDKSNKSKNNNSNNDNRLDTVNNDSAVASEVVKESSTNDDEEMKSEEKSVEGEKNSNISLPSFPGTTMTTVAGSNDVKLEIAGSSLFDRVILYSLKNTVVDNSRLDAAKHKYLMNNGNVSTSFNTNSNGSDSNSSSSSRSVEKIIEEFKGCNKSNIPNNSNAISSSSTTTDEQHKSDSNIENLSNGADNSTIVTNSSEEIISMEIKTEEDEIKQQPASLPQENQQQRSENEDLDLRDKNVNTAMLDLSVKRDEKSMPPIKRSHAPYVVGLPDFSKQIFTAPSISKVSNQSPKIPSNSAIGPPKIRNPDFSTLPRAPELQMRQPDFSKGFSKSPTPASAPVNLNHSNFPEIIKKNNYISDLQLKPPSNLPQSTTSSNTAAAASTSYKIDYRPSGIQPQSTSSLSSSSSYPNMKKESIYNYNNQQLIDEPLAHVIPKNQYNIATVPKDLQGWSEHHRNERLLGGSSQYDQGVERKLSPQEQIPPNQFSSSEDLRKIHPAHFPFSQRDLHNEFSLKQKEQQLRQEGTIITIKNEARTPTSAEITERRSADLFRDYKLKQPKESPDASASRRIPEPPPLAYHQQYPDFPANYPRMSNSENANATASPIPMHSQEYSAAVRNYHTPSPSQQPVNSHHKSPMTMPPGHSLMNPPQNWCPPPPLVLQTRHSMSPATQSSTPPNYYPLKHSRSPSESPISHFINPNSYAQQGPSPTQKISSHHQYRYPEPMHPNNNRMDSRQNNYYHQKQPDFSRRFENQSFPEQHRFAPIDSRPQQDPSLQRLPVRQDLEIRTVRHSQPDPQYNNNNMQYINSSQYPAQSSHMIHPRMPLEGTRHHDDVIGDRSRIPPDLKIERRSEENKNYAAVRRQPPDAVPELSIIPKVKTEPQNPQPSTSNVIKPTKSLFAPVKRESPLDLSVKTVKTKADSTGGDQDFQSRHPPHHPPEVASSLKIEFSPNFGNASSKTDCRQQARLGPQEHFEGRSVHVGAERQRFSHKDASLERMPSANKNQNYQQKFQSFPDASRPHTHVPSMPDYFPKQIPIRQQPGPSSSSSSMRYENNIHTEQQNRGAYPSAQQMQAQSQNLQYPVINKPSHAAKPTVSNNPKDHMFLEKERDRKYVENLLYGRNRRENHHELHHHHHQPRQFAPIPSPPRKRHLEMAQHMYNSIPPKQSRVDNIPKPFGDSRFSDPQQKIMTPPMRNESFPHEIPPPSDNNNAAATKHYPDPRKDAIKSAEMAYQANNNINNNASSNAGYYPNPKAEMIHRSDPNAMKSHKFFYKETAPQDRIAYHQNFHKRPDDNNFPTNNSRVVPHPYTQQENNVIKVEQQQTGPLSELSGDKPMALNFNGVLLLPSAISGSNGNIAARGAEQSTIQKLKSNLEFKEQQKLKIIQHDNINEHHVLHKKDLSPRQFRTKAEMKGYIPLPTALDVNRVNIDSPSIAPLPSTSSNATSAFDLLDWGSACNDFVQQLQTGSNVVKKKTPLKKKRLLKSESSRGDEKTVPGISCNDLSLVPKEILNSISKTEKSSSSDEDKPLTELRKNLSQQDLNDKFSRNFREKQRHENEQKFAARLGRRRPSSSESETDTRKGIIKGIKRVRRLRKREALGIIKTDDEHSKGEVEGGGESDYAKRRNSKSISKHEDITSSDEEGDNKKKRKKKNDASKKCIDESKKKAAEHEKKVVNKKSSDTKSQTTTDNAADTVKKPISSDSSDTSSSSSSEEESMQDKINKLSSSKNAKRLKDLGDKSNIKNLLEEGETMTRSKRKLENEKKLSNSKVLRNDKVIQNVSPRDKKAQVGNNNKNKSTSSSSTSPLKRKDSKADEMKRKTHESDNERDGDGNKLKNNKKQKKADNNDDDEDEEDQEEEENSQSAESEVEEEIKTERLRPRKPKVEPTPEVPSKVTRKKIPEDENVSTTPSTSDSKQGQKSLSDLFAHREDKTSNFKPGWETEAYNYKRSLKIPPGLITIGRQHHHGISHSLPDLDPQTSDTSEIFSEFVKSKEKEGSRDGIIAKVPAQRKSKASAKATEEDKKIKPNSIIDLLHNRVMQSKKKFQAKKKATVTTAPNSSANKSTTNDNDLLPTPEKESDKIFGVKKNIFETFILTSRTRTENNSFRKKEMLKEVFGADEERPRSAPPIAKLDDAEVPDVEVEVDVDKKISYDQKFREYLEKMNVDFLDKKKPETSKCDTSVKDEDDDFDDNETIAASEKDSIAPTLPNKIKTKKNRQRRCKGSSGFDYIRKKKKPTTHASENPLSVNNIIKKRLAAMESLETKDENDICKEIKGWVRNKSVGESILHKASRLNYVDVVAYCLDRMGMDPNIKDNAGYTPLHEACSRGHLEIARLLLQFGANHSETAFSGIRPLHEAIENGHAEIVRLLLSFGADPCLATYSGQLPISLAEDKEMEEFLHAYLVDINHKEGPRKNWFFESSFKIEDPDEIGYAVFDDVPINKADLSSSVASVFSTSMTSLITATTQMSDNETVISETTATSTPMKAPPPSQDSIKYQHKMKKCDTNSNNLVMSDANNTNNTSVVDSKNDKNAKRTKNCSVILNNINIDSTMKKIKKLPAIVKTESPMIIKSPTAEVIQKLSEIKHKEDYDDMLADETLESDCEFFEVEESEAPLPPLYFLKDEGTDKWMLLSDLCNLLKVKSKEAVLKQICPSSPPSQNKDLIRELKMPDFLERATCLQLFCAGEKLNVRASKVSLVRYTENVKNLLGVQTFKLGMSL